MSPLRSFLEAFIPLFVAIDPAGLVPVFVGVTEFLPLRRRRLVSLEAVGAALLICIAFMLVTVRSERPAAQPLAAEGEPA